MHIIFLTATFPRKPLFSFPIVHRWQYHTMLNPLAERIRSSATPLDPIAKSPSIQLRVDWDVGCMAGDLDIKLFRGRCTYFDNPILLFPSPSIMRQANVLLRILIVTIPPVSPTSALAADGKTAHQDRRTISILPRRATFLPTIVAYFVHESFQNSHRQRKRAAGDRLATGGPRSANGPPSPQQDGRHR